MKKETAIKSDALAANLRETRTDKIDILPEHQEFLKLSADTYSIHNRAVECLNEYNHPFSNSSFVIGQLRSISLGDFWFYDKPAHNDFSWETITGIYQGVLQRSLSQQLAEEAVHSLLELIEKMLEAATIREARIEHLLSVLSEATQRHPVPVARNSTYLIRVFSRGNWPGETGKQALSLASQVLIATATYWNNTTNVDQWLADKRKLFGGISRSMFKSIGSEWYMSLIKQAEDASNWEEMLKIPGFNDISLHIRQLHHGFERFHEEFYFLVFLLHLEGMQNQKELLLRDFNNLLRNLKNLS